MKAFWEKETLFLTPDDYFRHLLLDIKNAAHSIILETYIFKYDELGERVIRELIDAQKRGIVVKVLLDGLGSSEQGAEIAGQLRKEKIDVRLFRPLPWRLSTHHLSHFQGRWYEKLVNFLWRINKRNHRKLCIVDDAIAYVGSFNITQDHFGSGDNAWKDLGARVEGKNVDKLKDSFEQVWNRVALIDKGNNAKPSRLYRFRYFLSNNSRKLRREKNAELLYLIKNAQSRVWITNAYFSPSLSFLKALRVANQRGVSVRLLLPEQSDIFFFPALTSTYYADLLKAGIAIYEYHEKLLHEKSMLIDNLAIIGSTNLNYRSLLHDLELDLLLNKPETIAMMEKKFSDDLLHSQPVTVKKIRNYPKQFLLMGWVSRFLRYWF